jgi:hypothetical protein
MLIRALCLSLSLAATASVYAQLPPAYTLSLQLREALSGTSYNIPNTYSLSSATVAINDHGNVAVKATSGSHFGIWYGNASNGGIVHTTVADTISDTALNNSGLIVWNQSGIRFFDTTSNTTGSYAPGPMGATVWSQPYLNQLGQVGYRATVGGVPSLVSFDNGTNTYATHATQAGDWGFLFVPTFNNNRQLAAKVQLSGSGNQNEVRLWNPDGTSTLIASDAAAVAGSPYTSFFNSVGVNDHGWVSFNAALAGGGRGVFLSNGSTTITIANSNTSEVSATIDSFVSAVNNAGLVTLRGTDDNGKRAIWVGNGSGLTRVVTEDDIVMTDLGPARVRIAGSTGSPFSGAPTINELGQVAFAVSLVNPDNPSQSMGRGVFVASPVPEPGTLVALGLGAAALLRRRKPQA